jgi:hypothetical protein
VEGGGGRTRGPLQGKNLRSRPPCADFLNEAYLRVGYTMSRHKGKQLATKWPTTDKLSGGFGAPQFNLSVFHDAPGAKKRDVAEKRKVAFSTSAQHARDEFSTTISTNRHRAFIKRWDKTIPKLDMDALDEETRTKALATVRPHTVKPTTRDGRTLFNYDRFAGDDRYTFSSREHLREPPARRAEPLRPGPFRTANSEIGASAWLPGIYKPPEHRIRNGVAKEFFSTTHIADAL